MKFVPNAITRRVARQLLVTQKHSPTILFAAGVVGVVGTTVLACRATLKLEETLEKNQENRAIAEELHDNPRANYSEEDYRKDVAYIHVRNVVAVARLYLPAVALGTISIAALCGSHHILSRRNVALTAAYAALEKSFGEYRDRVIDKLGPEKERELYHQVEKCEIDDEDTGKKKTKKVGNGAFSPYAVFFDDNSQSWSRTPEYNLLFLRCQQNWANDRLRAKGHVFLNEVYDSLGVPRTTAGAVTGWVHNGDGDNFIDFGIFDTPAKDSFYDFATGHEGGIWLDFNVDGVIYDRI